MEREGQQQLTFIDLEDHGSRRAGVVITIVVVLLAVLVFAPPVLRDLNAPSAEVSGVGMPAGRSASPALCRPAVDVPQMLDPVARIILPGWTRLCGWIANSDIVEPFDPSG